MYEDLVAAKKRQLAELRPAEFADRIEPVLGAIKRGLGADRVDLLLDESAANLPAESRSFASPGDRAAGKRIPAALDASSGAWRPAPSLIPAAGASVLAPITLDGEVLGILAAEGLSDDSAAAGALRDIAGSLSDCLARLLAYHAVRGARRLGAETQRLEVLGRLTGGLAHDLNNVFTTILGNCELLGADLSERGVVPPELAEIRGAVGSASALLDGILSFSRGRPAPARSLDLNWLLVDTSRLLRGLVGRNIEIQCEIDPDLGAVVADPVQLEQVIVNLAVNARDAMPSGGRLQLAARNRDVPETGDAAFPELAPGAYVELSVTDTGCGMPAGTRHRAFDPFFTTKTLGRGNGLGLAGVARVAAQFDGAALLESEEGKGTTVRVVLPRKHCVEARRSPAPRSGRIALVVDPDRRIRALLRNALEREGMSVREADSEDAARVHHLRESVDLLITDLGLPQLVGRELATQLSATQPGLRVLYLANHSERAIRKDGLIDDAALVVQRPVGPRPLALAIRRSLSALEQSRNPNVISSDALPETGPHVRRDIHGATLPLPHHKLRSPGVHTALGKAAGL